MSALPGRSQPMRTAAEAADGPPRAAAARPVPAAHTGPATSAPPPPRQGRGARFSLARLSLGQQMVLLAVLPATLAMMGAIGVLMRQYLDGMTELVRANAQTVGLQLATAAQAPLAQLDRRALLRLAQSGIAQPHVQQVQVWSDDGEILANAETQDRARGAGLRAVVPVPALDGRGSGGQVMVEMSLDAVGSARRAVWLNVLLALGASLAGVALAAGWAARRISAPIRRLARAVDRLGAGEEAHVAIEGAAEVRRLQHGFNATAHALAEGRRLLQSRIETATAELARKNAQLEVASQAKTRLLAAASHDLRQPLYALTLFSSTLRAGETDPARLERIRHIEECAASLDQLFSELLDLSRLEAGSMRAQPIAVRLDEVFDEASRNFRMLAESRGLRLVLRKTGAWVHCDRTMLGRILNNLISNALRYTDSGGVLVGVRHQASGQVRIDVWDTGCGIAPEHQQRVFEEFYQVRTPAGRTGEGARGLGLGLATVRRLVDLVGGRIALASRPGKGTRVALWLDACTPAQRTPPPALDVPLDISGLRVLAIDDEPGILQGLRTLLAEWGCDVRAAASPAEALEQLRGWFGPPDLVISDLHLGDGPDGLEALQAIARQLGEDPQRPGFARLLLTGETRRDRLDAIAARQIPVLFKPVQPQRLREAMLAAVLAARARRDTPLTEHA